MSDRSHQAVQRNFIEFSNLNLAFNRFDDKCGNPLGSSSILGFPSKLILILFYHLFWLLFQGRYHFFLLIIIFDIWVYLI